MRPATASDAVDSGEGAVRQATPARNAAAASLTVAARALRNRERI
jgi:hypothetical protein